MHIISLICIIFAKKAFIMLIQFSVRNFKSFREKATLSLVASGYDKTTREIENVTSLSHSTKELRLLKSAVIYGANASGKTKLVEALYFMKQFVRSSADEQPNDKIKVEPFLLDTYSESESSEFEVIFIRDGIRYRYGFEILPQLIVAEWLFKKEKDTEIEVFYRNQQEFEFHGRIPEFKIGRKVAKDQMVKSTTLWLTAAAKWNDDLSKIIIKWFQKLHILSGLNDRSYMAYTLNQIKTGKMRGAITNFVRAASIGLEEISIVNLGIEDLPDQLSNEIRERIIQEIINEEGYLVEDIATYRRYDKNGNRVANKDFKIDQHESAGTRKYLALSGPVLDVLANGSILIVDELDARLHPNLVCKIIELFNSKLHNPMSAQLIFNTHDTNLLNVGLLRRDQIWFTEKDRYGASILYSLNDYSPRKNENLEKNYLQGNYGGIPYLGNFEQLIKSTSSNENAE